MHIISIRSLSAAAALLMFLVFTGPTPAQARVWISQGGALGETTVLEAEAHSLCGGWFYDVKISPDFHGGQLLFPLLQGRLDEAARMRHTIQIPASPPLVGVWFSLGFQAVPYRSNYPLPFGVSGGYRWVIGAPPGKRFVRMGAMPASFTDRSGHAWVLLKDGKLLHTGGFRTPRRRPPYPPGLPISNPPPQPAPPRSPPDPRQAGGRVYPYDEATEVFLFDFRNGTSRPLGSMNRPRENHEMVPLSDGSVLIFGGDMTGSRSVERYDPDTMQFQLLGNMTTLIDSRANLTPIVDPRTGDDHVLLTSGLVGNSSLTSACLFDVRNRVFTTLTGMCFPRWDASTLALPGGRVFLSGGMTRSSLPPYATRVMEEAEIFDFHTRQFFPAGKMRRERFGHTLAQISPTRILIVGGKIRSNQFPYPVAYYDDLEVFDGVTFRFTPLPFRMHTCRANTDVTPLPSGSFLITGGEDGTSNYTVPLVLAERLSASGARPLPPILLSYPSQVHVRSFGQGQLVAFTDFEYFFYR